MSGTVLGAQDILGGHIQIEALPPRAHCLVTNEANNTISCLMRIKKKMQGAPRTYDLGATRGLKGSGKASLKK